VGIEPLLALITSWCMQSESAHISTRWE